MVCGLGFGAFVFGLVFVVDCFGSFFWLVSMWGGLVVCFGVGFDFTLVYFLLCLCSVNG